MNDDQPFRIAYSSEGYWDVFAPRGNLVSRHANEQDAKHEADELNREWDNDNEATEKSQ